MPVERVPFWQKIRSQPWSFAAAATRAALETRFNDVGKCHDEESEDQRERAGHRGDGVGAVDGELREKEEKGSTGATLDNRSNSRANTCISSQLLVGRDVFIRLKPMRGNPVLW